MENTIKIENADMTEITVNLLETETFTFALPDMPEGISIEAVVHCSSPDNGIVTVQAWLVSSRRPLMRFMGDILDVDCTDMYGESAIDKVIGCLNESETFLSGVAALLNEDYDYFISEYSEKELNKYDSIADKFNLVESSVSQLCDLLAEHFSGILEYIRNDNSEPEVENDKLREVQATER